MSVFVSGAVSAISHITLRAGSSPVSARWLSHLALTVALAADCAVSSSPAGVGLTTPDSSSRQVSASRHRSVPPGRCRPHDTGQFLPAGVGLTTPDSFYAREYPVAPLAGITEHLCACRNEATMCRGAAAGNTAGLVRLPQHKIAPFVQLMTENSSLCSAGNSKCGAILLKLLITSRYVADASLRAGIWESSIW